MYIEHMSRIAVEWPGISASWRQCLTLYLKFNI